jgi:hypothetical protein
MEHQDKEMLTGPDDADADAARVKVRVWMIDIIYYLRDTQLIYHRQS